MGCCPHIPALSWELDVPALRLPALPFGSVLSDESLAVLSEELRP
jgi:hypothetical protein